MAGLNPVRVLADLTHTGSKAILIYAIIRNRSAEGVSLLTQVLYIIVFLTRYIDLLWTDPSTSSVALWNSCFKILYISSSFFIVFLMLRVFARTREREASWKLAIWSLLGCVVITPLTNLVFHQLYFDIVELFWIFSIELESVCILPQLLLLRQTSVPTVIDSYYLVTLGTYRFLYLLNWILKGATGQSVDAIGVVFGVVQTLLYLDFAWTYYSRQRVKLRGGAVVDSDDLGKSLLVRRLIGTRSKNPEEDIVDNEDEDDTDAFSAQEAGRADSSSKRAGNTWGARGISVTADDTLHEHDKRGPVEITDPAHFEDDEDDDDDDDDVAPMPPAKSGMARNNATTLDNAWASNSTARPT